MLGRRFVLLALICAGSTAHADDTLPGGATLKFNRLLLHEDNSEDANPPEKENESIWGYFNLAHCVCSAYNHDAATTNPAFFEDTFAYEMTLENSTMALTDTADFFVGADCGNMDSAIRNANCTKVSTLQLSSVQSNNVATVELSVFDLMVPKPSERGAPLACPMRDLTATTWALVDTADSGGATYAYQVSDQIVTDSKPPPLPTKFTAAGAEKAISIDWTAPDDASDIAYYQALCAKTADGTPALAKPSNDPQFQTARRLCQIETDEVTLSASPITTTTTTGDVDAGTGVTLPTGLAQLDKSFICGESSTSTATGIRIGGLENGVEYTVALLAIDKYGNASGTYFTSPLVPQPATDFWEDLHGRGSGVEGGFCLIAQTYGDDNPLTQSLRSFRDETLADTAWGRWLIDVYYGTVGGLSLHGSLALRLVVGVALLPVVAFALLWHLLTLPGLLGLALLLVMLRRLRRTTLLRTAAAGATLACIALAPTRAHAQSPYWEDQSVGPQSDELPPDDPRRVQWHAGLRLGPYVPGIDAQLDMPAGSKAGPYEQMFGGYSILPMIDVERFFFHAYGQLGLGISVGYMGKKDHPWQAGSDPADPKRPRSTGDENKFRLLPLSLNVVYRMTLLDDVYGIPFVPYARAGLAYYIWWIRAPDGDFAEACKDGSTNAMCDTTSARGASLGFVGSLGLAIRAERIDSSAARSMHESGIEHAGFYAEWSLGKVDGFGSDKKLSVGDSTWFAGVDFEF